MDFMDRNFFYQVDCQRQAFWQEFTFLSIAKPVVKELFCLGLDFWDTFTRLIASARLLGNIF